MASGAQPSSVAASHAAQEGDLPQSCPLVPSMLRDIDHAANVAGIAHMR